MAEAIAPEAPNDLAAPSFGRRLADSYEIIKMISGAALGSVFEPRKSDPAALYESLGAQHSLGSQSFYYNLGYWKTATTYDQAAEALAEQLGLAADFQPGDRVVDAGFGFGDQDFYWLDRFGLGKIFGINITPVHVEIAQKRAAERDVREQVDFRLGSATALPYDNCSVNKVVALEAAFHFDTREDFFREAFRVLSPGGTIAVADIVFEPAPPTATWSQRMHTKFFRSYWQVPNANVYGMEEYAEKLRQSGFVDVQARSIFDDVYVPFHKYFRNPEVERPWFNPILQQAIKREADAVLGQGSRGISDFVLISAKRPQ